MGLVCDCRATAAITDGTITITLPGPIPLPVTVTYSIDASICPDCTPGGSFFNANFSASALGFDIAASFESTSVGLPVCENGVLTVEVEGTLTVNGDTSEVTATVTLNGTEDEVCIDLPDDVNLPIDIPCLAADVEVFSCEA
ncbi:YceI family protein [Cytobacillus sp. FJAT-54145]|uniref:YceI family protein n=1 Tax=Cytobacillus spartinae TaxID=3299023 RepID=A0ABW6K9M1_9BACI